MKVGNVYDTVSGEFRVRVISMIGNGVKRYPVIGEVYSRKDNSFIGFATYTKEGKYLHTGDSVYDLDICFDDNNQLSFNYE